MYCKVNSAMISGMEAIRVIIEADISNGMPSFSIVGSVSTQIKEAQDRVKTALRQVGIVLPPKRITINLAPGDIRKSGVGFDLPIAALVSGALGCMGEVKLDEAMILGELRLDGTVSGIRGILPCVLSAKANGCKYCIVPEENRKEAELVDEIDIIGVASLKELLDFFTGINAAKRNHAIAKPARVENGGSRIATAKPAQVEMTQAGFAKTDRPGKASEQSEQSKEAEQSGQFEQLEMDFCEIKGQPMLKRACTIAAAGFHNLLLIGPPGVGKSMAAKRMPGILGALTKDESMEVSNIYSIAGRLHETLMQMPPFRSPHISITPAALCGGGKYPKPGELTLAHRGILFLDELPEIRRETIELLRQALEDKQISVVRTGGNVLFPTNFLFLGAMNPCPCGHYPNRRFCKCTPLEIARYHNRISHAILDRIPMSCRLEVPAWEDITCGHAEEIGTAQMFKAAEAARNLQASRYEKEVFRRNAELTPALLEKYCPMTDEARTTVGNAFQMLGISARGYRNIIQTARTIADLEAEDMICEAHISEAICFRTDFGGRYD